MEEPAANAEPPPGLRSLLPPREFLCSPSLKIPWAAASWPRFYIRGTKSFVTRSTVEKYLNSRDH